MDTLRRRPQAERLRRPTRDRGLRIRLGNWNAEREHAQGQGAGARPELQGQPAVTCAGTVLAALEEAETPRWLSGPWRL